MQDFEERRGEIWLDTGQCRGVVSEDLVEPDNSRASFECCGYCGRENWFEQRARISGQLGRIETATIDRDYCNRGVCYIGRRSHDGSQPDDNIENRSILGDGWRKRQTGRGGHDDAKCAGEKSIATLVAHLCRLVP
jgi:hypothetical protein